MSYFIFSWSKRSIRKPNYLLFLVRRANICRQRRISSCLPIIGSNLPSAAICVRLVVYNSRYSPGFACCPVIHGGNCIPAPPPPPPPGGGGEENWRLDTVTGKERGKQLWDDTSLVYVLSANPVDEGERTERLRIDDDERSWRCRRPNWEDNWHRLLADCRAINTLPVNILFHKHLLLESLNKAETLKVSA